MFRTKYAVGLVALIWFGGILYAFETLAAPFPGGTLLKSTDNPAVFYLAEDGNKYKFPDSGTYRSWYYDYRQVRIVEPAVLAAISDAGMLVTVHPGSALVKFTDEEKIYAVGTGALLRFIPSVEVVQQLYGKNWEYRLIRLSPGVKNQYRFGPTINSATDFNRNTVVVASRTIDDELDARRVKIAQVDTASSQGKNAESAPGSFEPKLQLLQLSLRGKMRPDFHPDRLLYRVTAESDERYLRLTPTATDSGAKIDVNGLSVASGIAVPLALNDGLNVVRMRVLSSTGKERVYIVMVSKNTSDDNNVLAGISENLGANLTPSFRADETEYTLRASYGEDSVKLKPNSDSSRAKVRVNGANVSRGSDYTLALLPGENTARIEVEAESGSVATYTITIDRTRFPHVDALDLASLKVSLRGSISPAFNPKQTMYYVRAEIDEAAVTITAHPKQRGSAIMIDGAATEQKRIRLYAGRNEIDIRVDIDETHSNTYRLVIDKIYE